LKLIFGTDRLGIAYDPALDYGGVARNYPPTGFACQEISGVPGEKIWFLDNEWGLVFDYEEDGTVGLMLGPS